ncbi:MAG TPA: M28 family peptidase, partial [Thermoanaerobaculia bacterium]
LENGEYPIPAYSEFMPAPRLGRKPLGSVDPTLFHDDDPFGWTITHEEEANELQPGLRRIAQQLLRKLQKLGRGEPHGIARKKLDGNPCWSFSLRAPAHERYVLLLPLALSRTQDDKGRIRWTLFGASDHGASRPFLRTREPLNEFFERLLLRVYGERSISGFRVHNRSDRSLKGVRYLLTFTPFQELPRNVREAYLHGDLHLLPFPGSLLFFHAPPWRKLQAELPAAMQIPLLQTIERNEAPRGIRVPQSGWMHEGRGRRHTHHGPIRNTMHRTNRWARVHRHEDELAVFKSEERVAHILFSSDAYDLGLYDKPMARNSQIWTHDYRLLLDGPRAGRAELIAAANALAAGGMFGYRFYYPPMLVGRHEVFWHRPLVAWLSEDNAEVMEDAPLGYLSAGEIELEPRLERVAAGFSPPGRAEAGPHTEETFRWTAKKSFETRYWKTIERLAEGRFVNKDNADCVLDKATRSRLAHHWRDLERLGDSLLDYYRRIQGITVGWLPFHWQTDFDFPWSGGWLQDQEHKIEERDIVAIIPGRNHKRAVIMADHYDTAYMEDKFGKSGRGPRLAAPGADDNHSATAALMLAAPIFIELSRAGKLQSDIWLVHLTGEEFPADCLGARHLCRCLVEGRLQLHRSRGKPLNLSRTKIEGAFVLDMVAHNSKRGRDIFQICPGFGHQSMMLAETAQEANAAWNAAAKAGRHRKLHGDVRPPSHPHSTLYNTDAQIFSDVGIPVVLFMENYDINRRGYHDSHDTMENIDLDYGAALVAIAIETVARVAGRP